MAVIDWVRRLPRLAGPPSPAIESKVERFHCAAKGLAMMVKAAAAHIIAERGTIRHDARVVALRHSATSERWTVVVRHGAEREALHLVQELISSAQPGEIVPLIEPRPSAPGGCGRSVIAMSLRWR